MSSRREPLGIA